MADRIVRLIGTDQAGVDVAYKDIGGGLYAQAVQAVGATGAPSAPTAAVLADNTALPTTTIEGAALMAYDGTFLDLLRTAVNGMTSGRLAAQGMNYDGSSGNANMQIGAYADALASLLLGAVTSYRYNGATMDRERTPAVFKVVALTAATAETTIWTPASGKKARVMVGWFTASAQTLLTFKDGTGLTTILALEVAANQPFTLPNIGNGILSGAADRLITVTRGTSAILNGVIGGTEE